MSMSRSATITWRLPDLMRARNHMSGTELSRALTRDGAHPLTSSRVNRMLARPPETVALTLVGALCRILSCTPDELFGYAVPDSAQVNRPVMTALQEANRKTAVSGGVPSSPELPAEMPRLTDSARALVVGPRLRALKAHPLSRESKE